MENYKELQQKQEAELELQRCRKEFDKLCLLLPNLPNNQAVFGLLMKYFDEPKSMLFDFLSGASAISNDRNLAESLGYQSDEEVAEKRAETVAEQNARQMARPVSELHAELKQRGREFRKSLMQKPKPPADLTSKKFFDASPAQARAWAEKYSFDGLNRHWAEQEFINA